MIQTTIQGIPCQVKVTRFKRIKGSFSRNAPSDMDYHGYVELGYEVYDRKGYKAPWLTRKMTGEDSERIEAAIYKEYREE